ncbi:hypothetical protein ILYODFUR_015325 [Ilyodon furcidens]|uniref:Uncharacterized protein n=1 Tax=Ilyodon furcidens TaxID=33524 RepID=A0ABV0SLF7_9TELE
MKRNLNISVKSIHLTHMSSCVRDLITFPFVIEIVQQLHSSFCPSDNISLCLFLRFSDNIELIFVDLINASLMSGRVYAAFRHVRIQPLIKKNNSGLSVLILDQIQFSLFI